MQATCYGYFVYWAFNGHMGILSLSTGQQTLQNMNNYKVASLRVGAYSGSVNNCFRNILQWLMANPYTSSLQCRLRQNLQRLRWQWTPEGRTPACPETQAVDLFPQAQCVISLTSPVYNLSRKHAEVGEWDGRGHLNFRHPLFLLYFPSMVHFSGPGVEAIKTWWISFYEYAGSGHS